MRGAASTELEGVRRYKGHIVAHRFLRVASSAVELRIRRLRMWQAILRDVDWYDALLGLYFGGGELVGDVVDNDGRLLDGGHSWAKLWRNDIRSLAQDDDLASLIEHWNESARVLLCDLDFRDRFCRVDFACLRARFLGQEVSDMAQPPALVPQPPDEERPFVCCCVVEGGGRGSAARRFRPGELWRCTCAPRRPALMVALALGRLSSAIAAQCVIRRTPTSSSVVATTSAAPRVCSVAIVEVAPFSPIAGPLVCVVCAGQPFDTSAGLLLHLLAFHVPQALVQASAADVDVDLRP